MNFESEPLEAAIEAMRKEREAYARQVLQSNPFQDALRHLEGIASDFLIAQHCVQLQSLRNRTANDCLLVRFAPHIAEAALAVTQAAKEGLQNAARRELRFILEASIKLSVRDFDPAARSFEERLSGLSDRNMRFHDYVDGLQHYDGFEGPEEAKASIKSLYSELSGYVHAAVPQFRAAMARAKRGERPGMESVESLNRFNKLAFQVYDHALVRAFHVLPLSMAGDVFTEVLDDKKWRFHKGKYMRRLSKCFDYKHERRVRHGES